MIICLQMLSGHSIVVHRTLLHHRAFCIAQILKRVIGLTQVCPGYREGLDLVLRDQNQRLRQASRHPSCHSSPPSIPQNPAKNEAGQALAFFASSWIESAPDSHVQRGCLEVVPQLSLSVGVQSPVNHCLRAISQLVFNKFERRMRNAETPAVQKAYGQALISAQQALQHAKISDETLMAVCLLGLYESALGSFSALISGFRHFHGAAALLQQRQDTGLTPVAARLLIGVRSQLAYHALHAGTAVDYAHPIWHSSPEIPQNPGMLLDLLIANLTGLLAHQHDPHLLSKALDLDRKFLQWQTCVPATWTPTKVNQISERMRTAGCYGSTCDVYPEMMICVLWNDWRVSRLKLLPLILERDAQRRNQLTTTIQNLADDICASVPFTLGTRTCPTAVFTDDVEYPCLPGQPLSRQHTIGAASLGGWLLYAPLKQVWASETFIRVGQVDWVRDQLTRLARIYDVDPAQGGREVHVA